MTRTSELTNRLRALGQEQEYTVQKTETCFELFDFYLTLDKPATDEKVDCCYAAVRLTEIVDRDVAKRLRTYLEEKGKKLPEQARSRLQHGLMRMAGF